jgi:hypothetical protein
MGRYTTRRNSWSGWIDSNDTNFNDLTSEVYFSPNLAEASTVGDVSSDDFGTFVNKNEPLQSFSKI